MRLGRAAEPLLDASARARFRLGTLPAPYENLAGEIDGRAVFVAGVLAGHAIWAEVPSPAADRWSSSELNYGASFEAGSTALRARDHTGGDVDWFTVDGDPMAVPITRPSLPAPKREVVPGRLDYPGAPNPRWWQLENQAVDIGGFAPDRSHFATMLLLDVVLEHADDWFTFPVPPPSDPDTTPSSGVLVTLAGVTVRDSFGEIWNLTAPPASGPGAWSLFHSAGLPESQLLVWPVAIAAALGAGARRDPDRRGRRRQSRLGRRASGRRRADSSATQRRRPPSRKPRERARERSAICHPRRCRTDGIPINACVSAIRSRAADW